MDKGWISIQFSSIRQARLMKRENGFPMCIDTPEAELASFIFTVLQTKNRILLKRS